MKIEITKTKPLMNVKNMKVFFHHPGQLFRNGLDPVLIGPYHKIANKIQFNIQSLSVIKNRQNKRLVCNSKRFDDDKIKMEEARKGLNCSLRYPGTFKCIFQRLFVFIFDIYRFYFGK